VARHRALKTAAACDGLKSANFIFTVTVRPNAFAFSHHAQTSSAMAATPASISAAAPRSRAKVVAEPEDLRRRLAATG